MNYRKRQEPAIWQALLVWVGTNDRTQRHQPMIALLTQLLPAGTSGELGRETGKLPDGEARKGQSVLNLV
jgi:hypothetical protein